MARADSPLAPTASPAYAATSQLRRGLHTPEHGGRAKGLGRRESSTPEGVEAAAAGGGARTFEMALSTDATSRKLTYPKPRGRPVSRSTITCGEQGSTNNAAL
jgi:hypothetical protein